MLRDRRLFRHECDHVPHKTQTHSNIQFNAEEPFSHFMWWAINALMMTTTTVDVVDIAGALYA